MSDTTFTLLSIVTTTRSNLSNLSIVNGQLIFVRDARKLYFDYDDKRVAYGPIVDLATEAERASILAPVTGSYYYVVETNTLWTYQSSWVKISDDSSLSDHISDKSNPHNVTVDQIGAIGYAAQSLTDEQKAQVRNNIGVDIPDWNQNDESASDYIKNRPFYTGAPIETVIIEEASFSGSEGDVPGSIYPVIEGQEYTVVFDGTEYTTTGYKGYYGNCALGNYTLNGINQGDDVPFFIVSSSSGGDTAHVKTTSDGDHTIKLFIRETTIHKIDEKYLPDLPEQVYSKGVTTAGTGAAYTATVDGITALEAGISFTMIPHTSSTTATATLNVNGLGAKYIRQRLSTNTSATAAGYIDNWIVSGKPVIVTYNGTYWVAEMVRPDANTIYGRVPVTAGGVPSYTEADDEGKILKVVDGVASWVEDSSGSESSVADATIPSYWVSELETKANDIQIAMEAAGRKKSAFLWYTDAHWPNGNSKMSPILLDYLYRHTSMNKVNFGGDIIGDSLLASRNDMTYLYEWRQAIKNLPNHHSVAGNHDMYNDSGVDYEDDNYRYAFLIAPEESSDMVIGDGMYYYIDNPAEKTRYLYFAYIVSDHEAMTAQGQFMVDAINGVSDGWHIVAINHRWWQYSSSSTPTTGALAPFEAEMLSVFDAYNARTTLSSSNYFATQDFTNAKGKIEFCIGGHIHVDYDFETTGGIPVIHTTADANQDRIPDSTVDSGTIGTITEAAVFGIIADYNDADSTKITVVGVGRGTSRVVRKSGVKPVSISDISYSGDTTVDAAIDKSKFSFTVNYSNGTTDTVTGATSVNPATIAVVGDNTVTVSYTEGTTTVSGSITIVGTAAGASYTNLADPTSGDWLTDSRFSTSSISAAAGGIITNRISCAKGDTVRVKGLNLNTTIGGSYARIRLYNGTDVVDTGSTMANRLINSGNGSNVNGDVTTLVLADGSNDTLNTELSRPFDNIRLNGLLLDGYTSEDVIITVNEEIV